MTLNVTLFKTLGFSGLAFLMTGLVINRAFPIPDVTLLIDQSYCPKAQWQQVSQTYRSLYSRHQRRQLRLKRVIQFNPLGTTTFSTPPLPASIQQLSTHGQFDLSQQKDLQSSFPNSQVLSCDFPSVNSFKN